MLFESNQRLILRRSQLFFQLLGRDAVELFDIGAEVTVIEIVELFTDLVQVDALGNHAFCEQGTVIAEEVFRFESNGGFDVALELDRSKTKHGCYFFDIKGILFGQGEQVDTFFVKYAIAFAVKWCGCDGSAHNLTRLLGAL